MNTREIWRPGNWTHNKNLATKTVWFIQCPTVVTMTRKLPHLSVSLPQSQTSRGLVGQAQVICLLSFRCCGKREADSFPKNYPQGGRSAKWWGWGVVHVGEIAWPTLTNYRSLLDLFFSWSVSSSVHERVGLDSILFQIPFSPQRCHHLLPHFFIWQLVGPLRASTSLYLRERIFRWVVSRQRWEHNTCKSEISLIIKKKGSLIFHCRISLFSDISPNTTIYFLQ